MISERRHEKQACTGPEPVGCIMSSRVLTLSSRPRLLAQFGREGVGCRAGQSGWYIWKIIVVLQSTCSREAFMSDADRIKALEDQVKRMSAILSQQEAEIKTLKNSLQPANFMKMYENAKSRFGLR
jgi:hypothetical protein